jgi:hypothetical protein
MQWYYAKNGERRGPVEDGELVRMAKDGRLSPDDLVWNQTMGQRWVKASTLRELFPPPPAQPPSTPVVPLAPRPGGSPSCVDAVAPAWRRMKIILFKPFDMAKWFALGFGAWLATLGEGGGGGLNIPSGDPSSWNSSRGGGKDPFADLNVGEVVDKAKEFWSAYGGMVLLVGLTILVLGVAIGLVLSWLQSRGKFMFLANVVNNRSEIAEPWREFRPEGNSLFLWRLVYGLICLVVLLVILAVPVFSVAVPLVRARSWDPAAVPGAILSVLLFTMYGLVAGVIARCLEDFVVPIMYRFRTTTTRAWSIFLPLLKAHFWRVMLYVLFYWVLGIGAQLCVAVVVIVTCCMAGLVLAIPYIGAVALLPMLVFFRAYSLEFLAQFGAEYRLEPEVPTALPLR